MKSPKDIICPTTFITAPQLSPKAAWYFNLSIENYELSDR